MTPAWLEQRERGSVLGVRLIVGIAFFAGRKMARLLLYPACLYFLLFSIRSRQASRKYLARALGRRARFGDLFRHYLTFATVALDRFFLLRDRRDLFRIEVHGEELLRQVLAQGNGCLLLGAHLGSFEILRVAGTAQQLDVRMVMYEDNAQKGNTVARAVNPAAPERIIGLGRFDSMFKLYDRLQHNAWVGLLGDRVLPNGEQLAAPFLGELALFPTSPYRIALMLKRPVLFMTGLYRGENRYELHFEPLFDPRHIARAGRAHAIEQALRRYAARLDHYCREAPYNWFNFYDFWESAAQAPQTRAHVDPDAAIASADQRS